MSYTWLCKFWTIKSITLVYVFVCKIADEAYGADIARVIFRLYLLVFSKTCRNIFFFTKTRWHIYLFFHQNIGMSRIQWIFEPNFSWIKLDGIRAGSQCKRNMFPTVCQFSKSTKVYRTPSQLTYFYLIVL